MPDVKHLFSLWEHARTETEAGHVAAPRPPTREEIRGMTSAHAAGYAARRAHRAIDLEFTPDTSAPF